MCVGEFLIQIPLYASALFFPPTKVPKPIEGIFAPDRSINEFIFAFLKIFGLKLRLCCHNIQSHYIPGIYSKSYALDYPRRDRT